MTLDDLKTGHIYKVIGSGNWAIWKCLGEKYQCLYSHNCHVKIGTITGLIKSNEVEWFEISEEDKAFIL